MGIDFPHKWNNKVYDWHTIFPLKTATFEGTEFLGPQHPEIVLKSIYGDYMSIPKNSYPVHTAYMSLDDEERKILEGLAK